MGVRHQEELGRLLRAEARGSFFVDTEVRRFVTKDGTVVEGFKADDAARRYRLITRANREVASMKVQPLPGCCGVIVFSNFSGQPPGVAAFLAIGIRAADRAKYGKAILTLVSNSAIIPLLTAQGWEAQTFLNGKTDNSVTLLTRLIPQERRQARVQDTATE